MASDLDERRLGEGGGRAGRAEHMARARGGDAAIGSWWRPAVLVAVACAIGALYAVRGVGFVLDDWWMVRSAHFDGITGATGERGPIARAGTVVVHGFVYGVLGQRPLAILAVQTAVMAATAVVLFLLARRFVGPTWALVLALVWQLAPNHTSLEVWAAASNIAVALLLVLCGGLLLAREAPGWGAVVGAAACLAAAVLCYEATAPAAGLVVVFAPWLAGGRPSGRAIAVGGAALAACGAWILTHWNPDKAVAGQPTDLTPAIGAHVGWGIAPGSVAPITTVAVLVGIAFALGRLALPSTRPETGLGERLVVAGLVVVVAGIVPFAFYFYAPLGFGDRATVVSGVGAAMVVTGLLEVVHRWRAVPAWVALAGLAIAMTVVRLDQTQAWADGYHDAEAILAQAVAQVPDPAPGSELVFGPAPIQQDGVAAFLDRSNIEMAVQVTYGDPTLHARFTFDQADFDAVPPDRRIDIRPVSRLQPDVQVRPTA